MKKNILKILLLSATLFLLVKVFDFGDSFDKISQQVLNNFSEENNNNENSTVNPIIRNENLNQKEDFQREFQGNEDDIIDLVNYARQEKGLELVAKNSKLMQSALAKAEDMKNKNYFEHVSPEGLEPWFFAEKVDYKYKTFGENLAEGFFSAETVHEGWMNSEGHRENILNKDFKEMGVGIVAFEQNGLSSYLIVQHFGTELEDTDFTKNNKENESTETKIICAKEIKKNCKKAEEKKDELEEIIDDQKDEIKKAKKSDAPIENIDKMEDNLEQLRDTESELEDYLDKCDDYEKDCDEWK